MKNITKNTIGMTLVEIMLATAIMTITGIALLQAYITIADLSEINKEETIALHQLTNIAEAITATPFSALTVDFPDGVANGTLASDYATLVGGYALANESIVVSYNNPNGNPLEITITISWQDKKGRVHTKYLVTKRTS